MSSKKLITRIKGGLGNQLFCYAAAKRLALVNDAELIIDDVSGFLYDKLYKRSYQLDHFSIPHRKAIPAERFEPFSKIRRAVFQRFSELKPFEKQRYLIQKGVQFDCRILTLRLQKGTTYFDGFAQSESYFSDISQVIKSDLKITAPTDRLNQIVSVEILKADNAVAVHFRWFDQDNLLSASNTSMDYYKRAIDLVLSRVDNPHLFIFSDRPDFAKNKLGAFFLNTKITYVTHNDSAEMAYADFWLMSKCRHFIVANSTFSWWAAWLGERTHESIVISPKLFVDPMSNPTAWGFDKLIPERWLVL